MATLRCHQGLQENVRKWSGTHRLATTNKASIDIFVSTAQIVRKPFCIPDYKESCTSVFTEESLATENACSSITVVAKGLPDDS